MGQNESRRTRGFVEDEDSELEDHMPYVQAGQPAAPPTSGFAMPGYGMPQQQQFQQPQQQFQGQMPPQQMPPRVSQPRVVQYQSQPPMVQYHPPPSVVLPAAPPPVPQPMRPGLAVNMQDNIMDQQRGAEMHAEIQRRDLNDRAQHWQFPYHSPAYGPNFRHYMPNRDVFDQQLNDVEPDERPPFARLHQYHNPDYHSERERLAWEHEYDEMRPKQPLRSTLPNFNAPATVCRLPDDDYDRTMWWFT